MQIADWEGGGAAERRRLTVSGVAVSKQSIEITGSPPEEHQQCLVNEWPRPRTDPRTDASLMDAPLLRDECGIRNGEASWLTLGRSRACRFRARRTPPIINGPLAGATPHLHRDPLLP